MTRRGCEMTRAQAETERMSNRDLKRDSEQMALPPQTIDGTMQYVPVAIRNSLECIARLVQSAIGARAVWDSQLDARIRALRASAAHNAWCQVSVPRI